MSKVTFIEHNGNVTSVDLQEGWNLVQGATANGIEGILGECGGACACATCHCYIEETRLAELPKPSPAELDMLESVSSERRPNSRLACQIKMTPILDGLVVHLPETQD